ncbi:unnamed protein product [Jaminaea pallidilutea]
MQSFVSPNLVSRLRDCMPQVIALWFDGVEVNGVADPPLAAVRRWWGAGRSREEHAAFNSRCSGLFSAVLQIIADLPAQTHSQQIARELGDIYLKDGVGEKSIESYHGILSLVLLLDQMPRCVFLPSSPVIYRHYDAIAQALSLDAISRGVDTWRNQNSLAWRLWFYLPLEHSEDLAQHQQLRQYLDGVKPYDQQKYLGMASDAAAQHHRIIKRFGRYPYRNEFLGRSSTADELEWIGANGNPFASI